MKRAWTSLKQAVEAQHAGTSTFVKVVPVREMFGRELVWEGEVYVFDLVDNPKGKRAYAWSSPLEGGKRRLFAVLHSSPITGPVRAVRATIMAEQKGTKCAH